jgi:hypothetical protein
VDEEAGAELVVEAPVLVEEEDPLVEPAALEPAAVDPAEPALSEAPFDAP